MKKYTLLNVLFGMFVFFFIVSFSIAMPIMCRFIHTFCIEPMGIVDKLNSYAIKDGITYTFDDVVKAYNDVVDSCCFYIPFKSGGLKCPPEDVAHFEDCRILFTIDFVVLGVTFAGIIATIIVEKAKKIKIVKPLTLLITGILTIVIPCILGGLCAIDFDKAFVVFHSIFFPGKTNWYFSPNKDFIILILPESFFMVCAIVIGATAVLCSTVLIVLFFVLRKKFPKEVTVKEQ